MKKVILGLLLLICFNGWGQENILTISNKRKVADTIFGLLDTNIYGNVLIDRSLTDNPYVIHQFRGNYNDTADGISWLKTYADVAISYLDSTFMMNKDNLIKELNNTYLDYEVNGEHGITKPSGRLSGIWRKEDTKIFYDGVLGATSILRSSVFFSGFTPGKKYYKSHISFLPMVSALAINPNIWQNNNLFYNLKDHGLMYNKFGYDPQQDKSDYFGYPNLGHPTAHFNITPFEAIYCDPVTSEHIKMQKSAGNHHTNNNYLVHLRNFILDEVEADVVYMQNKNIGQNHVQWMPYTYKTWYKAHDKIVFGDSVTPKTDIGPYIIENTGDITAYAGQAIVLKPGFHAENGSKFHAFIYYNGCSRPRSMVSSNPEPREQADDAALAAFKDYPSKEKKENLNKTTLKVFPNPSSGNCTVVFSVVEGKYVVFSDSGKLVLQQSVKVKRTTLSLPKGVYILKWRCKTDIQTQKIIVL